MDIMIQSLYGFTEDFSVNKAIMLIMAVFAVVGGIDKIRGNKYGYGEQFDAGFNAMGPLAAAMVGMIVLVPVIEEVFGNAICMLFSLIGADPSLFAGIFIGTDIGGYQLAMGLAEDEAIGNYNGIIVTAMMGASIIFNIPIGMSMVTIENRPYFAVGMLIGFATIPIGCFAGGAAMIAAGYDIGPGDIIMNTIPVIVISAVIISGLVFFRERLVKIFNAFGKWVIRLIIFGTVVAAFQYMTGIRFPLFYVMVEENSSGTVPLIDALQIVGCIGIVLIGAFPMVHFVSGLFGSGIKKRSARIGLDEDSVMGMIATLANNIPTFGLMEKMNPKGKIMNSAFLVSSSWVLGDHLGFCAGVNPEMIAPMLAAKFAGGISAVILAEFVWVRLCPEDI